MSDLAREDALHDVCSVKTVHAVRAHHTDLSARNGARLRIDQLSLTKSNLHISHKMSITHHLLLDNVDEFFEILPFHLLALPMEVEPHIVNVGICDCLVNLRHFITNALLAALFVDQVNPELLRVILLCLSNVLLRGLKALIKVLIDGHGWCPCHSRLHLPDQRDTSPGLQVACNRKAAIWLLLGYYMLRLAEVRRMAFFVQSADHEPPAHSARIFSRNQYKARFPIIDVLD